MGFEMGLMGFEGVRRGLTKTEKTSLLLFIAPPSLMLLLCVPANVSELTFSVPQTTSSLSAYEQHQGR